MEEHLRSKEDTRVPEVRARVRSLPTGSVLIIDDDPDMLALLGGLLEVRGMRTELVANSPSLLERLDRQTWDLIVMDLYIGNETALELIPEVLRRAPYSKVVVISAFGSIDAAVFAMELGAATFLQKSPDLDDLVSRILAFLPQRDPVKEPSSGEPETRAAARSEDEGASFTARSLVGESPALGRIRASLPTLARGSSPFLLEGKAGTGKESVARAVHEHSARFSQRFEAINCAALTESALDLELFGDPSTAHKPGLILECQGGTLLLKEVGALSARLQEKLLHVLHEGRVPLPDGTESDEVVQTRIVASSREPLREWADQGRFRDDLLGLLGVKTIALPPLSERPEDVEPLVLHFTTIFERRYGKKMDALPLARLEQLAQREWPGDVRELQNTIERAVVLSKEGEWSPAHLGLDDAVQSSRGDSGADRLAAMGASQRESLLYSEAKEAFEKAFLEKLLEHTGGNVSEAARLSGRFRSDLYRLMSKYGLARGGSRSDAPERDPAPDTGL